MRAFWEAVLLFCENMCAPIGALESLHPAEAVGFVATRVTTALFLLCYAYQFFYMLVAYVKRPHRYASAPPTKRYAVVVAARNEQTVLPFLLKSIRAQTYPGELIDMFVVADNCTDDTAAVARACGAEVTERFEREQVGKGYALQHLFSYIEEKKGLRAYDAYFIFDADNVLQSDYVQSMHDAYCAGFDVVTSYRNSKNYGKNWVSAGYALWFLREARQLNHARAVLGSDAAVAGTGFLVDSALLCENGGWKHFLLTEDLEFTADCMLRGKRIGYAHNAEFFDEQPERFSVSWRQRKRWSKGLFQVILRYGGKLLRSALRGRFCCFDMLMTLMPAFLLSTLQLAILAVLLVVNTVCTATLSPVLTRFVLEFFLFGYGMFLFVGALTLAGEWRRIHCNKWRAVALLFTFPLFMLSYIPVAVAALVTHVEWAPIAHRHAMDATDIVGEKKKK